jgi:streptomycin 6-kinase
MLDLPPEFIRTIQNTFGEDGKRWLDSFPALLTEATRRWGLTEIQPVPNLSYNFVALAALNTESNVSRRWMQSQVPFEDDKTLHSQVVFKLGVPHSELTSEIAALQHYAGRGTCRLLDADAEKGMLLLERLQPGNMLSTLEDDDRTTHIAADVMKSLWECSNDFSRLITTEVVTTKFIQLKDWFDGFQRLRQLFSGGTGPLPKRLVETVEALSSDLLSENKNETLLHGDFHHFNVLDSARGWLAIDPKGVIGPRGYELGPFLINPLPDFLNGNSPLVQTQRRISILSEMLGMERERIRAWGLCHAVLSAWWCIEGNDPVGREYSVRCAEVFRQVRV